MTMDAAAAAAATATRRRRRPRRQQGPKSEEDAAQAGAAEETLLALRLLGRGAGLRHPLHGHAYARYTALRPRVCHACEGAILGPFSKACHCLACGLVVHRACVMRVPKAPCGSYRGLRDPDGRRSLPREAQEAAAVAAAAEKARASPPPKLLASGPKQAAVDENEGEEEDGRGQQEPQGQQPPEQQQADGPATTSEGTTAAAAATASSERRSMTYEALAMVGRLVGTMTGSAVAASSASASGSASPVKDSGAGSSAGGGFGFATLRSGARAIAGAYAGYTSRAQQEEDEASSSSDAASSHLQAARQLGLSKGLGTPSPVATAWSQLAQRILREAATDAGGGGQARLLDFTAFVKHLEALEAAEAATAVFAEVEEKTPTSGGSNAGAGGGSSSKRGGLIADILKSQRTAPGYLWAACLRHFRRRHDPEEGGTEEDGDGDATDQSGEGRSSAALLPPAPASQDAAAIIHEVALVLVDFVPGLLSASYLALGAYEEAFEAVEGLVMATLAPFVLAECRARTGPLTAAVAAWYERQQEDEDEDKDEDDGDHGPAIERAAQELRALAEECTGPRKVRRVLQCCLALGEGEGRVMSADELLPALGKAVRRATVPALPAHLAFVEETCDTGALLGAEGYALTSLQVVVSLIVKPPSTEEEAAEQQQQEQQEQEEPLVDR